MGLVADRVNDGVEAARVRAPATSRAIAASSTNRNVNSPA